MWKDKANVECLNTEGRRIIAVSDIHANLPYFKALLERVGFCESDVLILCGDFLEKGEHSLDTLRYIMELRDGFDVHPLCGNCDEWQDVIEPDFPLEHLKRYLMFRKSGLIWDMLTELGYPPDENIELSRLMPMIAERYKAEFDFLSELPHIIETPHYIFTHGGVKPDVPLHEQIAGECMKFDDFMSKGYSFSKWVVVGHWPVMLYRRDRVCAAPIIDTEHRIISIDGGCVLKDDGQLNALIIPYEGSEAFAWEAYDPFPTATVTTPQKESDRSYYICWGDNKVKVLCRGDEFSHCRHIRSGYEMDILTKYLYGDGEETECNDCTDFVLELNEGDRVSVVEKTSRGSFVKFNGCSGWYYGELNYEQ